MAKRRKQEHIDHILSNWPFESEEVSVRIVPGADGRDVLQMRVEMGLLQLEVTGRPDGERPNGCETYLDHMTAEALQEGDEFVMSEEQCAEADREFVQYYHRRVCWLALREYDRAVEDASHTLALMDFCRDHSPDEEWTMTHEQYRPFVLFHRTQADALARLEGDGNNGEGDSAGAEVAIHAINQGLQRLQQFFSQHDLDERYDDDELVSRLVELRESLRQRFEVGRTLQERLADAVAAEEYELAARLRDELRKQHGPSF